jgi:arylsulfatase A-like enzyme
MPRNILFIMCDQLRQDYLSCYGHRKLNTPNIDSLAARGVRFSNAYCQAALCGPSRASFYSGRYMSSHGVMANEDTTRLDELTIADYLRPLGYRSALVGKTDNRKSTAAMQALGIDLDSDFARAASCGGFEPFERHEGLYPDVPAHHGYTDYLKGLGYPGHNPWHDYANSGEDSDGNIRSGWLLRNSAYPARVAEPHSESVFTTDRAIEFLDQHDPAQSWCLHLSYIKPHWPLIAPAPYHDMFDAADIQPALRSDEERENPHPVYQAFMQQEYSESYSRDEVRETVVPVYMGLIKQIDDQLGRLFNYLKDKDLIDQTMIVFTSDHGDYLGDHWLGEKDLMHEASVKIPLILVDPDNTADDTRGTVCAELVEAIDLLPTFVEYAAGNICRERVEGRSLMPLLQSKSPVENWREFAVSEIDYSGRGPRTLLGIAPYDCRALMIRDRRWKYIHYDLFRPQLFDLENDPGELTDLGEDPAYESLRADMHERIFLWQRQRKQRTGLAFDKLADMGPERDEECGIIIGRW